jgi:alpha-aminoadipate/glutamate carrier protein LysW
LPGAARLSDPRDSPNRALPPKEETIVAYCPECEAEIELEEVEKGDLVDCPECGANLEVIGTSPVELELATEEEEEDWG